MFVFVSHVVDVDAASEQIEKILNTTCALSFKSMSLTFCKTVITIFLSSNKFRFINSSEINNYHTMAALPDANASADKSKKDEPKPLTGDSDKEPAKQVPAPKDESKDESKDTDEKQKAADQNKDKDKDKDKDKGTGKNKIVTRGANDASLDELMQDKDKQVEKDKKEKEEQEKARERRRRELKQREKKRMFRRSAARMVTVSSGRDLWMPHKPVMCVFVVCVFEFFIFVLSFYH